MRIDEAYCEVELKKRKVTVTSLRNSSESLKRQDTMGKRKSVMSYPIQNSFREGNVGIPNDYSSKSSKNLRNPLMMQN